MSTTVLDIKKSYTFVFFLQRYMNSWKHMANRSIEASFGRKHVQVK
uniref:Uncharacterized protein n=1 Tax=Arundo donax TaxID=35708 RepID=A0A0A9AKX8_ARUDO